MNHSIVLTLSQKVVNRLNEIIAMKRALEEAKFSNLTVSEHVVYEVLRGLAEGKQQVIIKELPE